MSETTLILEAGRAEEHYWRDLWRYRELFSVLAWRDVAVRYKQTVIGVAWAVLRPFLTMVIFTVVFGRVAKLPSDGAAPYALMVFAGLLPWSLFSAALTGAAESMVANANLIGKVYFPRIIVPAATLRDGADRFPAQPPHPGRDDGLVPVRAGLADPAAAALRGARAARRASARASGSLRSTSSTATSGW